MIPFNRAALIGRETEYIQAAVESGVISGEGYFSRKSEVLLQELLGPGSSVYLTPSCTHALEMSALLLGLEPGDEVILPSFTFVTTASAFALRGARPVFADVEPTTLNIDPESVRASANERTKAIVVVHYAGIGCDMESIFETARQYDIPVIEDAAHGLGATHHGKPLGSFGKMATFSFHETKNVTCGEGGALVVNDPNLVHRAQIVRDKGTNRQEFFRGDVPFYTWVDLGSSYRISDVAAAFLFAQLEHLEEVNRRRREICRQYAEWLQPLKDSGDLAYPGLEESENSSGHIFYILLESETVRSRLQKHLRKLEIHAVSHYEPLHLSPYVLSQWGPQPELPVTECLSKRLLRLPLFYSLRDSEQSAVTGTILSFFDRA